jgi:hypothetical protein
MPRGQTKDPEVEPTGLDLTDPRVQAEIRRQAKLLGTQQRGGQASGESEAAFRKAMDGVKLEQARALIADEAQRNDPDVVAGRKKLQPLRVTFLNTLPDPTVPRLKDGTPIQDDAEFQYKWVPRGDNMGREGHDTVIQRHLGHFEYEIVTEDGEPIESEFGVLMRVTHDQRARIVAAKSPTGGVSPEVYYKAKSLEVIDDTNNKFQGNYLKAIEPEHHLSRSNTLE